MHTIGVIGTGKIAGLFDKPEKTDAINTHAEAIFNNPKLKLVSAVNPHKASLNKFSKLWGIRYAFTDIDDFLNANVPDVVTICSPNETHFQIISKILSHPVPPKVLFVEKPVVTSPSDLKKLLSIESRTRCLIAVNHKRRMDPAHLKLYKVISSGFLGEIIHGKFTYYGGWLNNGVHLLDLIIMLFGDQFRFEYGTLQEHDKKNDPCIDTTLLYDKFKIEIESFEEKYYQLFEGEFRFDEGRILYKDFGNEIFVEKAVQNKIGERELKPINISPLRGLISPFKQSYSAIVKFLDSDDKSLLKGMLLEDAAHVMEKIFQLKNMAHGGLYES